MFLSVLLLLLFAGILIKFICSALIAANKIGEDGAYSIRQFAFRFLLYTLTFDAIFWIYWSDITLQLGSNFIVVLTLLTHVLAGYFCGVKIVSTKGNPEHRSNLSILALSLLAAHLIMPYIIYWISFGEIVTSDGFYVISLFLLADTVLGYFIGVKSEEAKYIYTIKRKPGP